MKISVTMTHDGKDYNWFIDNDVLTDFKTFQSTFDNLINTIKKTIDDVIVNKPPQSGRRSTDTKEVFRPVESAAVISPDIKPVTKLK